MRERIVTEAREWLGTPYHHQQATKGVGCDCVGLIRGVGVVCGAMKPREIEWATFGAYSRRPNPRHMLKGMRTFLVELSPGEERDGDIAWLAWREDLPMHLAILATDGTGTPRMIHSYSDAGRVVEHGVTDEWRRRIVSFWRYPELEEA